MIAVATPARGDKYGTYWQRAERSYGGRRLDELRARDLLSLQHKAVGSARRQANSRHGRHAGEGCIRAMRLVYRLAIADGVVSNAVNPAAAVPLPRRLPNLRRALTTGELAAIYDVAYSGGNDVVLETACRRGGALALTLDDLDATLCSVRLREKGGTVRMQPISRTLSSALLGHAACRGATAPSDPLCGTPITPR